MLKNLFKYKTSAKPDEIELFEDEHPRLFEFIRKVCDEVGAPYPAHVYVDFNVNAAAIAETYSIFNLILPTNRSLLVGMGLVNAVNLTEFKAVLAHEFGHFAQGAKISHYFSTVFTVIGHVIYGEDWFDSLISAWADWSSIGSESGPGFAFRLPARFVSCILWCLRKLLDLLAYVIYVFYKSYRRQCEFNADLVAVSVTGSDAPVHLLAKCDSGYSCWQQAAGDLKVALDNHIYTSDFFYHQTEALRLLKKKNKDNRYRVDDLPPLPKNPEKHTQVFDEADDRLSTMWQDHPSNYDRELNAKNIYIRSEFDDRSPWLLFDNADELKERITYKFYRYHFRIDRDVILADPIEVQGFIDEEHGERTYNPMYQGLYDNRDLFIKGLKDLAQDSANEPWTIAELAENHAKLYSAEVKHRSQLYYKRREEQRLMIGVFNGWHKPKNDELEFRGDVYEPGDAKRLLKKVEKELEADIGWLAQLDRKVFMTYFQMALQIHKAVAEELYLRYEFQLELQNIWYELQKQDGPMDAAIDYLNAQQGDTIPEKAFEELLTIFRDTHKAMKTMLKSAKSMTIPGLQNMPAGQSLRSFLLSADLIDGLSKYERSVSIGWINELIGQFREMRRKIDRVHFKSLAGILALQERIGLECTRRWAKPQPKAKTPVKAP